MRIIGLLCLTLLLQACAAIQYQPAEYPIKEGRISEFPLKGEITVENLQLDSTEVNFFDGTVDVLGNYKAISELMAQQLANEIESNGLVQGSGTPKTLGVRVVKLWSEPRGFHIASGMTAEIEMGNGKMVRVGIDHGSPSGVKRVLNGSIALTVIKTLSNPAILDYLAE